MQSFDGRKVRDSASELPEGYDAPAFQTQALQHSNVKSTWDADNRDRRQTLVAGKRATKDDIRDDDFKVSPSQPHPPPPGHKWQAIEILAYDL